jgi:magnesium transporter
MVEMTAQTAEELWEAWPGLSDDERVTAFQALSSDVREDFFESLDPREQAALLRTLPTAEHRLWLRSLAPDDVADLLGEVSPEEQATLLGLLDDTTRTEVRALLAYAEDEAGGLMNPRFARIRPAMTVAEAIPYLKRQAPHVETIYYAYVLDEQQRLLGVLSFRELFQASEQRIVRDIMHPEPVTVSEYLDQEAVGRIYVDEDLLALPVVDADGRMKGIITFDDIADVVRSEATEDIQKVGGTEALGMPYLTVGLAALVKKRAGWLAALFLGEMLTATAMAAYQGEIAHAVVLALFVPLIISSGGNSGSQATTLVIRAMALEEVRLGDWWRVCRREAVAGLILGVVLGAIGLTRILVWQGVGHMYGAHYFLLALTVACSLVGVVLWGSLAGSMLPFLLRRVNLDPASASAPLVATLVDVSGLMIYFGVAKVFLTGTLL